MSVERTTTSTDQQRLLPHSIRSNNPEDQKSNTTEPSTITTQLNQIGTTTQNVLCGQRQFIVYLIYNILRYIAIGILLYQANEQNHNQSTNKIKYCCPCYFLASNQTSYVFPNNKRIDLSYCIPECTSCKHCETAFPNGILFF